MQWTEPNFEDISLNMEVTAYTTTDDETKPPMKTPLDETESVQRRESACGSAFGALRPGGGCLSGIANVPTAQRFEPARLTSSRGLSRLWP